MGTILGLFLSLSTSLIFRKIFQKFGNFYLSLILGVIWISWSFRVVLEGEAGKEIPVIKIQVIRRVFLKQLCFMRSRGQHLRSITRGKYRIWIWMGQGSDQVQGYKDCSSCLIPAPTVVGSEQNFWFLDTLKRCISELILLEKKCLLQNLSCYIYFRTFEFGSGDHGTQ